MMLPHSLEFVLGPDTAIEKSADGLGFKHLQNKLRGHIEIAVDIAAPILRLQGGGGWSYPILRNSDELTSYRFIDLSPKQRGLLCIRPHVGLH